MVDFEQKERYTFDDLLSIMRLLRAPGGCPWDREQDHKSIRRNFIEETYEVVEAIDEEDAGHLKEELGDVLLQVVFHTEMEAEKGTFDIDDVCDGICKKLIYRHPHIFSDVEVADSAEVLQNWDALKRVEKSQKTSSDSMVAVARSLPQLLRAEKIQSKAAKVGFDWPDVHGALDKVREEFSELTEAIGGVGDPAEELGDLLFSVVNVARFLKTDPEHALEQTCDKFIRRFAYIETTAKSMGKAWDELSLAEMDAMWEAAKHQNIKMEECKQ